VTERKEQIMSVSLDEDMCGNKAYAGGYVTTVGPTCKYNILDSEKPCNCSAGSGIIVEGLAIWDWYSDDPAHFSFKIKTPVTPPYYCANSWKADQDWLGHIRLMCE
jgi:hypothetical protein